MHVLVADVVWHHLGKHLNKPALVVVGGVDKANAELQH